MAALAAPPDALMAALGGMGQGANLPCQIDNIEMPEYLIDFVADSDHASLLHYLDGVLAAGAGDEYLRPLFERAGAGARFDELKSARDLFEGMRRVLRRHVKSDG